MAKDVHRRFYRNLASALFTGLFCLNPVSQVLAAPTGNWELTDYDKEHAHGKSQIALWLSSAVMINPASQNAYDKKTQALLTIQCTKGKPALFINHNFEWEAAKVPVAYQLDGGKTVEETWSADTSITLVPSDSKAFEKNLLGKRVLAFTFKLPGKTPASTQFQVEHLDAAMAPLREQCDW